MAAHMTFLCLFWPMPLVYSQDCTSNFIGSAEADFNGDFGVDGTVSIASNGSFHVDVTVESHLDTSICSGNPFPLQYHIHEFWNHEDGKDKYGDQCGADYTGAHYNPYGRPACTDVTIPTFYNCEIGDLSGRFGQVTPGLLGHIHVSQELNDGNCVCGRLTPEMGYTRSIVFHCNGLCNSIVILSAEDAVVFDCPMDLFRWNSFILCTIQGALSWSKGKMELMK